jgi:nucleotide-binding universal stress UspA family protein
LARGLGRSTAHYLVRTLDVPLLVVAQPREPFTRVLTCLDLSDASVATLKTAERFASLLRGELRIMHAVEPFRLMYLPIAPFDEEGFAQRSRDALDRLLAPLAPLVREHAVVRMGPAAEAIGEEVSAWHADLLVVGSHGKGWVDRLLLGSTTERLLNALPTSLLVVPTALRARRPARRSARRPTRRRVTRKAKTRA